MTVLTLPAVPGQDTAPRTVPWRKMVWVTWRQHRALLISLPAVLGAIAVFLLIAGQRVHHDYAAIAGCSLVHQSGTCGTLIGHFNSLDWTIGNICLILMNLAPPLIGAFAGGPVLARELENGTFRYAWTQGLGRERQAIAKLALLGLTVAVLAGALGQLFAWFFQPFLPVEDMSTLTATVFQTRGLAFPAWVLVAFAIGAFLGMLFRRIIPAMAATLAVYFALVMGAWKLRDSYPASGFWPMQVFEAGWLLAVAVLLMAATVWLVRRRAA